MTKTTAIRKSARGEACTARIPFACNGNWETTVYAHVGSKGAATDKRNPEHEGANGLYACSGCHDAIDLRNRRFLSDDPQEQLRLHDERRRYTLRGMHRTQQILREKGLLAA